MHIDFPSGYGSKLTKNQQPGPGPGHHWPIWATTPARCCGGLEAAVELQHLQRQLLGKWPEMLILYDVLVIKENEKLHIYIYMDQDKHIGNDILAILVLKSW